MGIVSIPKKSKNKQFFTGGVRNDRVKMISLDMIGLEMIGIERIELDMIGLLR